MIEFGSDLLTDFEAVSQREWLETNGIGGYAASSLCGANQRRYHGLLVASTRPPLGRMVLLSKFEEAVTIDGATFEISCNQYPGVIAPKGYQFLKHFELNPFPVWTFEIDGIEIKRSVFMIHGENTTVCRWSVDKRSIPARPDYKLELKPLLAFRDHHHLRHEDAVFDKDYAVSPNLVSVSPLSQMPILYFSHNATDITSQGYWYRNFEYGLEKERGFDYHEDLFQPFSMTFDLRHEALVIVSTEPKEIKSVDDLEKSELSRRGFLVGHAGAKDDLTSQLLLASDQFIVSRGDGKTVIAGYPWFSDWGRDTMIALNGLTISANRPDIARSILGEFSMHISYGMLPNRFPDLGETPEYNTVDATLWFFEAIRAYAEKTGDLAFVRDELYEKLVNIIEWHIHGTRYGIHVDTDGLLFAGEIGTQLTWMDAKVGDRVITPRMGKPVEIQALWYNALRIMESFAKNFGDGNGVKLYSPMADMANSSFNGQFWNEDEECLFDVVNGDTKDASVRPNQILAVSLPHTMLPVDRAGKVVEKVEAELLTPVGLRSLSPKDPAYCPIYIGAPQVRDAAYHQGTVWAWLIGPFVDAYRRVHRDSSDTNKRMEQLIDGFSAALVQAGVGQVSEIFDGDAPHHPRGCPAQAWSVAELLRTSKNRNQD